jgi:hypothetical protein
MFDSLDDQIKRDEERETTKTERFMRWAAAIGLTAVILGGLYLGVQMLE